MKGISCFMAVLAVCCMATAGSAAIIIDCFEDGDATTNPTWILDSGNPTLTVISTDWSPLHVGNWDDDIDDEPDCPGGDGYSLLVQRNAIGWGNTMKIEVGPDTARGNHLLTFDAKAQGGTDVPSWWAAVVPVWNSDEPVGNWHQGLQFDLVLDGQWHKYIWDYSDLVDGNSANGEISATAGSVQLVLASMANDTSWQYTIDNIRLIPEPASLSLMGLALGGLLMLRRRG